MARTAYHLLTWHHISVVLAVLLTISCTCTAEQLQQPVFGIPPSQYNYYPADQQVPAPSPFSPSMAIVIVVLIAAFFFLGFFSIYIRRCAGDRGDDPPPAGSVRGILGMPARRSRHQPRGLDPEVIETFPTMAYADVKAHKAGKGALECAVCLSEFEDDEKLRLLPKCSHVFHPDCIDTWLASHVTCPVCRANLVPDPNAPADAVAALLPVPLQPTQESSVHTTTAAGAAQEQTAVVIDIHTEESNENEEEMKRREEEAAELERIGSVKRALRSKSGRGGPAIPLKFPRSHTTGHSLAIKVDENLDRFTLRLPEHVLREIVAAGQLKRSTSLVGLPGGEASTRRGYRRDGSSRAGRSIRLGRSGRWGASFLPRNISVRMPKWGSRREPDGSTKGKVAPGDSGEGESRTRGGQI